VLVAVGACKVEAGLVGGALVEYVAAAVEGLDVEEFDLDEVVEALDVGVVVGVGGAAMEGQ